MKQRIQRFYFIVVLLAGMCAALLGPRAGVQQTIPPEPAPGHTVTIPAGDLTAVYADNTAFSGHSEGQNGIASLVHAADPTPIFQPGSSGLNFEFIFDGQKWYKSREEVFEPRVSPMTILRLSETSVELHQPRSNLHRLESWTRFTMVPPHYIDMQFTSVPHASTFDRGYIGLFWASYINTAVQREYYFIGRAPRDVQSRWLAFLAPAHNAGSSVRHISDSRDPSFKEDYPSRLFNNYADMRYSYPFYYGRRGRMMLALMFDQPGAIRFSHSPTSGAPMGSESRPAWDFYYLIHNYRVGTSYGFNARLVYKPFVSSEDVIVEYERWSGKAVARPQ